MQAYKINKHNLDTLDLSDDLSRNGQDYEYNANDIWDAIQDITNDDSLTDDPSFPRQHRYDTKKPGPGYYIHESDSSSQEMDPDVDQAFDRLIEEVEQEQKEQQKSQRGSGIVNVGQKGEWGVVRSPHWWSEMSNDSIYECSIRLFEI